MKNKIKEVSKVLALAVICSNFYFCAKKTDTAATTSGTTSFTTSSGTKCDTMNVKGIISTPTTWKAGKVYVVTGDITVKSSLTIEAGVVIKFLVGNDILFAVATGGSVNANGTAANHITFTSFTDDTKCGDNNGDGSATSPQKGNWERITITNGSTGNIFNYCDILYAGYKYNKAISFYNGSGSAAITNCTFAHTKSGDDKYDYALDAEGMLSGTTIENCIFYDNGKPISIPNHFSLSGTNSYHNPNNPAEINTFNGIFMGGNSLNPGTLVIEETEVPTVIDAYYHIYSPETFILKPGVIVKFMPGSQNGFGYSTSGPLQIGAGAIITSYKDDANGGDTNGDGNLTSPAKGDWDGVYDYDASKYISSSSILYAAKP